MSPRVPLCGAAIKSKILGGSREGKRRRSHPKSLVFIRIKTKESKGRCHHRI